MKASGYKGKYAGRAKAKLPLSVYLIYLLVATFMFTGVSFSRYVAKASGGDEARVAVMAAGVTVTEIQITGYPGYDHKETTHPIIVANYEGEQVCQVALRCDLSAVNIFGNIPLQFKFYEDESCTKEATDLTFEPNVKDEKRFYLQILWPESAKDNSYAFEIDAIRVIATATQVD